MRLFTLEDVRNARIEDPAKLEATTEEDIQRQIAEDGDFDMGDVDPARLTVRRAAQSNNG